MRRKVDFESSDEEEYDDNDDVSEEEEDEEDEDDHSSSDDEEEDDEENDESGSDDDEEDDEEEEEDVMDVPFALRQERAKDGTVRKPSAKKDSSSEKATKSNDNNNNNKRFTVKVTSKSAPVEVTSKVPVSSYRQVIAPSRPKGKDPRFREECGPTPNIAAIAKKYDFVANYRSEEISQLEKSLKQMKRAPMEEKEEIARQIQRLKTQAKMAEKEREKREKKSERKKAEKELVAKGKKPFFLKKTDEKILESIDKFETMGASKANELLRKKRKRLASKTHRFIPYARRDAE